MQQMPHAEPAPAGPPMGQAPPAMGGVAHEITHGPSFAMLRVDLAPGRPWSRRPVRWWRATNTCRWP